MGKYTKYPNSIDTSTELPKSTDLVTPVKAAVVNSQLEAIIAIESELGVNPSGTYTTVKARLDAMDQGGGGGGGGGSGNILVSKDGTTVVAETTKINFTGDVTVTTGIPHQAVVNIGGTTQQKQERFTPANNQTSFSLTGSPLQTTAVEMFLNGLKQQYGTDYIVSGTTVSWLGIALVNTDNVEFWYLTGLGTIGTAAESMLLPFEFHEYGVAGVQNTSNTIFTAVGAFEFDPTNLYSGPNIQIEFWFEAVIESSTSSVTTSVQLYNVTAGAYVTNTLLTTTSTHVTFLSSVPLTVPGNLPNVSQLYEIHISRTGGTGSDVAICKMARLVIRFSSFDANPSLNSGTVIGSITAVKTSTYSAVIGDLIQCDPSGGGFAITLPAAAGNANRSLIIKNVTSSSNTITVNAIGSDLIDGLSSTSLTFGRQSITLVSTGSAWLLV